MYIIIEMMHSPDPKKPEKGVWYWKNSLDIWMIEITMNCTSTKIDLYLGWLDHYRCLTLFFTEWGTLYTRQQGKSPEQPSIMLWFHDENNVFDMISFWIQCFWYDFILTTMLLLWFHVKNNVFDMISCWNKFFSCPGQLNRWPCHSLTN